MSVKEILNSYQVLMTEAERYRDIYIIAHEDIGGGSINYDGMPHGSQITSKTEKDALKLNDKYMQFINAYNKATSKMLDIEAMIDRLPDWRMKYVIHEHYIMFRPLSEIGNDEILGRSDSTVRRYHRAGINELERMMRNGKTIRVSE